MKEINRENRRFLIVLIGIMLIWALSLYPFKFGGWNQIMLAFSYRFGFIQRAFIGSVIDVVSTVFRIPLKYMRYLYGISTVGIFTLGALLIVYKALIHAEGDNTVKCFYKGMALVFFMGPGWCTNYNNFALTDMWLPMISLIGVWFILKGKHVWISLAATVICVLIHPAYVFLYFNLILAAFIYKEFLANDRTDKKSLIWLAIVFAFGSVLFIYMMFFSHAREGVTADEIMQRAAIVVDKSVEEISNHEPTVRGYLLRDGGESGVQLVINSYWLLLAVSVIMFMPFIFEIFKYWKYVYKEAKSNGIKNHILYALLPMGVVTAAPMYIMHNDYGRWTYAVFFYEFAIIWIFNLLKDANVKKATYDLMERVFSHKAYYLLLLFYAAVSGPFQQNLINPMISKLETLGWKLLGVY
ncbi:MAG: hypothetical protein LUE96_11680 [Lachnospiraceae bacterium]|nr:hypothetical protein [Lachnospiraceae bacterium]